MFWTHRMRHLATACLLSVSYATPAHPHRTFPLKDKQYYIDLTYDVPRLSPAPTPPPLPQLHPATSTSTSTSATTTTTSTTTTSPTTTSPPSIPPYVCELEQSDGRKIYLVGVCHVIQRSEEDVRKVIQQLHPDVVMVELDVTRVGMLLLPKQLLALIPARHSDQPLLSVISRLYRVIYKRTKYFPGSEFIAAAEEAAALGAPVVLGDRNPSVTISRLAYHFIRNCVLHPFPNVDLEDTNTFLITAVLPLVNQFGYIRGSADEKEEERRRVEFDRCLESIVHSERKWPSLAGMLDERDQYMASVLSECGGKVVVGVVGAIHVSGIRRYLLEGRPKGTTGAELRAKLEVQPSKSSFIPLLLPLAAMPPLTLTAVSLLSRKLLRKPVRVRNVFIHFGTWSTLFVGVGAALLYRLQKIVVNVKETDIEKALDAIQKDQPTS